MPRCGITRLLALAFAIAICGSTSAQRPTPSRPAEPGRLRLHQPAFLMPRAAPVKRPMPGHTERVPTSGRSVLQRNPRVVPYRRPPGRAVRTRISDGSSATASRPQRAERLAAFEAQPQAVLPVPNGDSVSLHLNEVDVRQALDMLSRSHGINIMVAPSVTGTVTGNFEGLSAERALNAIIKLCNLTATYEDGLVYVYSQQDYPQLELQVRVFTLDFASAATLLPAVEGLLTAAGKAFATEVDANQGRKTQEAIVVTDLQSALQRIEDYILQMDLPPPQVMIEAHVLQVTLGDTLEHGINYKQALQMTGQRDD